MTTPTILALDASSTSIGFCLYDGRVRDHGEIVLRGADIADRCRQAYAALDHILVMCCERAIDCIAIEAPASVFKKALIPQCRVSGALMACAALRGFLVVEVTPTQAKRALTSTGNADKALMQCYARDYGVTGEHASDAVGVALAAVGMVKVERQAA